MILVYIVYIFLLTLH